MTFRDAFEERGQCYNCGSVNLAYYPYAGGEVVCEGCGESATGMECWMFVGGPWPRYAEPANMRQNAHRRTVA